MALLSDVLLVDDDRTTCFLHRALLTRLGVTDRIAEVHDGRQALDLLTAPDAAAPALILLDINMPDVNGIEFLKGYEQLPMAHGHQTVVAVVTTSLHERDLTRLQQLPVAIVITKPLTRDKVAALLQTCFGFELPV